ncbi:MAG: helix-turn-helix transcriptional regulator [Thermoactinomyces sp.]
MLKPNLKSVLLQKQEEGYRLDVLGIKMKPNHTNLSIALGVSKQQVSMWVNGNAYPRPETLFKMAKLLDVPVDELYTLEETEEEREEERKAIEKRMQDWKEQAKQRKEAYRQMKTQLKSEKN